MSPTNTAGNPQDHVFNYFAPYVMDDWKVNPKLTLDLGLRWDYRAAAYEAQTTSSGSIPRTRTAASAMPTRSSTTNGVAPGETHTSGPILRYCGQVPHPGPKTPFAPRFGLNYRLTPKTVVRGGYGIFFDSAEGREIDDSADIYPYSIRNNLNPTTNTTAPKLTNNMFPVYRDAGTIPGSTL